MEPSIPDALEDWRTFGNTIVVWGLGDGDQVHIAVAYFGWSEQHVRLALDRFGPVWTQIGDSALVAMQLTPLWDASEGATADRLPSSDGGQLAILRLYASTLTAVLNGPVVLSHPQSLRAERATTWLQQVTSSAVRGGVIRPETAGVMSRPVLLLDRDVKLAWISNERRPFREDRRWHDCLPEIHTSAYNALTRRAVPVGQRHLLYARTDEGNCCFVLRRGEPRADGYVVSRKGAKISSDSTRWLVELDPEASMEESEFWGIATDTLSTRDAWPTVLQQWFPRLLTATLPMPPIELSPPEYRGMAEALLAAKRERIAVPRATLLPWEALLPHVREVLGTKQGVLDLLGAYGVVGQKRTKTQWLDKLNASLVGHQAARRSEAQRVRGTVYFAAAKETEGPVKVGWTDQDVGTRLRQLQTGHPSELEALAEIPGSAALEKAIHKFLGTARRSGGGSEWFDITRADAERISELLLAALGERSDIGP